MPSGFRSPLVHAVPGHKGSNFRCVRCVGVVFWGSICLDVGGGRVVVPDPVSTPAGRADGFACLKPLGPGARSRREFLVMIGTPAQHCAERLPNDGRARSRARAPSKR